MTDPGSTSQRGPTPSEPPSEPAPELASDCSRCTGLCCVALRFERSADFAFDKAEGERCRHLADDHRCRVHDRLPVLGMRGCTVFECFGAGQLVTQQTFGHRAPEEDDDGGALRYAVFGVVRAVQEVRWLLADAARRLDPAHPLAVRCRDLEARSGELVTGDAAALAAVDLPSLRGEVGDLLRSVSRNLRGAGGADLSGAELVGRDLRRRDLRDADLRGAMLVAADLRGVDLRGADLLGADLRDTDIRGADLSGALFVTPPQAAAARSDSTTRLPRAREAHRPSPT